MTIATSEPRAAWTRTPRGNADGPASLLHLPENQSASTDRHQDRPAESGRGLESNVESDLSPCGDMHEISVREMYLNGALSDAVDRMRDVI
jgi:hypothetical protein